MSTNSESNFRKYLGGSWFLDAKVLLIPMPLVITTSILTTSPNFVSASDSAFQAWGIYGRLLLANLFALAICALWVFAFAQTIFRNRAVRPIPPAIVIFFSAGVGALKGAATGLACWLLSVEPELAEAISSRVWQTTVLGAWLIPAVTLVAARIALLQEQRESLVAERVSNTLLETGMAQTRANQAALRAFAAMAKTELAKVSAVTPVDGGGSKYAETIRRLVTDQLRPLSHRIWDQENKRISSFSFSEISKNAIYGFDQAKLMVAGVYVVTSIPAIMRFVPFVESVLRALLAGLCISVGLALTAKFKPSRYWQATTWFIISMAVIAYVTLMSGEWVFGFVAGFKPFDTLIAIWFWLMQLTFITSFLVGIRKSGFEIKQEFAELYGSESIDRAVRLSQSRIQNRDFANYLHGQVQNKLLSVALGLERGEATKDELERALAMVEDILISLDSNFQAMNSGDIQDEITKINSQWFGFLSISWNIDDSVNALESRERVLLIQVIDEAISNAVRHGLAKQVRVSAVSNSTGLVLEIVDDGIGPRSGKAGLGSTFFKSVSKGNWSLLQEPNGGSRLTVKF
jgi:two-component sensor histidine kinase